MNDGYIPSVVRGMVIGAVCLGIAGTAAVGWFLALAITQNSTLVAVVPTVALGLVTAGALLLLKIDANARRRGGGAGH